MEVEDQIIALYAKGVSTREIQDHLQNLYGIEVSPTPAHHPLVEAKRGRALHLLQVPAGHPQTDLHHYYDRELPQTAEKGDEGEKHLSDGRGLAENALSGDHGCDPQMDGPRSELEADAASSVHSLSRPGSVITCASGSKSPLRGLLC